MLVLANAPSSLDLRPLMHGNHDAINSVLQVETEVFEENYLGLPVLREVEISVVPAHERKVS
jgi:hypothetical protein